MITIKKAIEYLQDQIKIIDEVEEVELKDAAGRILAENLKAKTDQPPFARSPLDGYTFCAEDSIGASKEHPVQLAVIDSVYAGGWTEKTVRKGEAIRIMTGAPIPKGADTVIRQEDTDYEKIVAEKENVKIYKEQKPYENYCFAGEDFQKGDCLLNENERLDSVKIGLAAAMGYQKIWVKRKPKVAVLTTGTELANPGELLKNGQIYNSNLFTICARIEELGGKVSFMQTIPDCADAIRNWIDHEIDQVDLLIITGGVSVGEKDLTEVVLQKMHANILFHGVKIKPGSPMLGALLRQKCVLGLSGNPFAAFVTLEIFLRPVLQKLTGSDSYECEKRKGIAQMTYEKTCKNPRFVREIWEDGNVYFPPAHASGVMSSLKTCNCLVEIKECRDGIKKGEEVCVRMI